MECRSKISLLRLGEVWQTPIKTIVVFATKMLPLSGNEILPRYTLRIFRYQFRFELIDDIYQTCKSNKKTNLAIEIVTPLKFRGNVGLQIISSDRINFEQEAKRERMCLA